MSSPHDPASPDAHLADGAATSSLELSNSPTLVSARQCPTCGQRFSGDACFCPFDGERLADVLGPPPGDPLIGKVVEGRYEVLSVLGEGGMGTVYAARHQALDKKFALKVMRADLAQQGELAARFIQEARAAAAIAHPNIVQITDFGALPSGAPYFVMELLQGMSLSKMIRLGGPLPTGQAVRFLQQTASALARAHAAGVVHRDLKPDNIHVSATGVLKVLDFGVAKVAGARSLTKTGMVFGSPHYMSPEQAAGGEVDPRTDVYALGVIMYEMFTGRVPFEADSYMGVLTKHMFMVPEPPSHVSDASRELGALEDVVLKCLEKKPEARYESMDALIHDVQAIAHFSGDRLEIARRSPEGRKKRRGNAASLADELEPPTREELRLPSDQVPPHRSSRLAIGLGALAAAILMAGVIYGVTRPRPTVSSTPTSISSVAASAPMALALSSSATPPAALAVPTALAPAAAPSPEPNAAASSARTEPAPSKAPRSTRPASPRPSGSAVRPNAPPPPATMGMPEIVNPWGR